MRIMTLNALDIVVQRIDLKLYERIINIELNVYDTHIKKRKERERDLKQEWRKFPTHSNPLI